MEGLKAGIKALKSFRNASRVEKLLAEEAEFSDLTPPYTTEDIRTLMSRMPRQVLDELVNSSMELYDIMFDGPLVSKVAEVIAHLVKKMKKRPEVYSHAEVNGMELGHSIVSEAYRLFNALSHFEQRQMVALIEEVERDAVEEVVAMKG